VKQKKKKKKRKKKRKEKKRIKKRGATLLSFIKVVLMFSTCSFIVIIFVLMFSTYAPFERVFMFY